MECLISEGSLDTKLCLHPILRVFKISLLSKVLKLSHLATFEATDAAWKVSVLGVNSGPLFPAFGLNNSEYGHFLRSVIHSVSSYNNLASLI